LTHFFEISAEKRPIRAPTVTGTAGTWQLIHWEPTAFIRRW
jgi:hypothetical protein